MPERVPRVLAHGRARVRVGVPGTDRGGLDAAVARALGGADVAVGLVVVRRLLRRVPGEDRHPVVARAPARAGGARGAVAAVGRGADDAGARAGVRVAAGVRAGAAAGASGARAAGAVAGGTAARVDGLAGASGGASGVIPGLVEGARARRDGSMTGA